MAQVTMPKMSDTMEEGTIVRWLKHPGDEVKEGEPIAEVETDKANVEMESFDNGVLGQILVPEGKTVPVGEPIATIEAPGATPAPEAPKAEAAPTPQAPQPEAAPAPPPAPKAEAPAPPTPPPAAPAAEEERMKVSPLARRLAQEHGVDLSQIHGTGPNGRIVEADIENYVAQKGAAPPAPAPAPPKPEAAPAPAAPAPAAPKAAAPLPPTEVPYEEEPLSRMRRTIAERMTHSTQTVPHFFLTTEVEMDWAARVRDELNADESQPKVSFNDIIIKACAIALEKYPRVNSSFDGDKLRRYKAINIGMAVALEDGLIVPVVHDADKKHLREIAAETKELATHARENQLRAHEITGATFTLTNLGMYNVENFMSIINPPEAASLAVGTIMDLPVVLDGQVAVSKRMKLTVSVDHRVLDGAEAAMFMQEVKHQLESPIGLL